MQAHDFFLDAVHAPAAAHQALTGPGQGGMQACLQARTSAGLGQGSGSRLQGACPQAVHLSSDVLCAVQVQMSQCMPPGRRGQVCGAAAPDAVQGCVGLGS